MLPSRKINFKISRTALVIIIAALLLAALLTTLTIRNIRREESLMQTFLLHEGMTLIRSFEAGARTTMMRRMEDDSLKTLVVETVKEPSVAYIRVADNNGAIIAASGDWPKVSHPSASKILASPQALTTNIEDSGILEIASPFTPIASGGGWGKMMGRWGENCGLNGRRGGNQRQQAAPQSAAKVIYMGLQTKEFDQAREVDLKHALLLGGILFLAGSAGFYLIFLYQDMRVARQTLRDMELYTNNVIESMPAGLITLDAAGRVVSCNNQAEEITATSLDKLAGKILADEIATTPAIDLDAGIMIERSFSLHNSDGQTIPVKISSSVLHDGKGKVRGLVIIIKDVREIFAIEQKLEQSRRLSALGRMATGIAHEIRNPLGTLRGFAQLFVSKFKNQPTEQEYARMMVDEVDRLNRTVSGLLQFARPREPEFQEIALNNVMTKTVQFMSDDFKNQGIDFHLGLPPVEITFLADPDLLQQILLNLLQNAMAATDQGGRIEMGADRHGESIRLWVKDSGCGMSPETKEQMFDPFFTTKKSGTGLGLAVVHQIITQHHGALQVESTPGQGTKIEISFANDCSRSAPVKRELSP